MKPVARNIFRCSCRRLFCVQKQRSLFSNYGMPCIRGRASCYPRPPFVLLAAAGSIARGRESMTFLACWGNGRRALVFFVEMQQAYVEMEKGKAYTEFLCVCIESCENSETQPCCSFRGVLKCVARASYACRSHPFSRLFFF